MSNKENMLISDVVQNPEVRKYLYLDKTLEELIDEITHLEFTNVGDDSIPPFFAKVRGYTGAKSADGASWLLKEIPETEVYEHKVQEMAYYMDFLLKTPAAPTILVKIEGKYFRATKHIQSAMQLGSYNYLEQPFKKMLANDLINRWLFFDEDRNPNNYLVIHDTDNEPFIVVIDYNKADLTTEGMKIYGNETEFGWHREEKTRFLTLLKPSHFENLRIDDFEDRLNLLMSIKEKDVLNLCSTIFSDGMISNPEETAKLVANNLNMRKEYIDTYFRKWFKRRTEAEASHDDQRFAGFGKSFIDYYKGKK